MVENCSQLIIPRSHRDKVIGILTSGTERYGMNAAVRACVHISNYIGSKIYIIYKGFYGLTEGGDNIIEADWKIVSDIIYRGGSIFGTGDTTSFKDREGRLKAAYNLIIREITNLIIIGGTMSMILSDLLKTEWIELLDELYKTKKITKRQRNIKDIILNIIYLPCSIDNFYGCDIVTIGRDSALHRITRTIDDIASTAHSDQRIYILEVLGIRNGYLALVAAICCEADYLFIPEHPPKSDWPYKLCNRITMERRIGSRLYSIIIMAESAIDFQGNKITPNDVKNVIFEKLHKEAYITVLGNVQRGGCPSAFDCILASRLGTEAVLFLVNATTDTVSSVVTLDDNKPITIPLTVVMKRSEAVSDALKNKNWELALRLNGQTFENKFQTYLMIAQMKPPINKSELEDYRLAIICVGAPACGINAVIECFVKNSIYRGHTVLGIRNGIEGLLSGNIIKLGWSDVSHLVSISGVYLGTKRMLPIDKYEEIAARLLEFNIKGLLIIGGFDAYHTCLLLSEQRHQYPEFRIPLLVIPATISNNVPGTQITIGSDTALNQIVGICDHTNRSHGDSHGRVFIFEVMGGYCGYLTTMAGFAAGSEATYIYEETFKIKELKHDINHCRSKILNGGIPRLLVIYHEKASLNYNIDFLRRAYAEESKGLYEVNVNVLGHMQQTGNPSPFDRNLSTHMAIMSSDWFITQIKMGAIKCKQPSSACVLGLIGRHYKFTPAVDLVENVEDFEQRTIKKQWWINLRPLLKVLSNRGSSLLNGARICNL